MLSGRVAQAGPEPAAPTSAGRRAHARVRHVSAGSRTCLNQDRSLPVAVHAGELPMRAVDPSGKSTAAHLLRSPALQARGISREDLLITVGELSRFMPV